MAHRMNNFPSMMVLAERSMPWGGVLHTTSLLCGNVLETATHMLACRAQSCKWRRPSNACNTGWTPVKAWVWPGSSSTSAVLEQWAAAIDTPSMRQAHMVTGPHPMGAEYIRQILAESQVWLPTPRHGPRYSKHPGM